MVEKKSAMVRIYDVDKDYFEKLASQNGQPISKVIHNLVEEHRQKSFFVRLKEEVSAAKKDPKAWTEYTKERDLWDEELSDGLEP